MKWVKLCENAKTTEPSDIKRNHYVCSKHFIGGAGPTEEHPDPVPAVVGEIETAHSIAKHHKRPPPKERCVVPLAKALKTDDIRADVDVRGKRAQACSLFARLFNTTNIRNNLIQLLLYDTLASGSLNFGMIIINYFLVTPKCI